MEIYSIGFTKKTAEEFFAILKRTGIRRLIDVRLNNRSQLAGFTKGVDLQYFLQKIIEADYIYEPKLTPTIEMLKAYRKKMIDWDEYARQFLSLMKERRIESELDRSLFEIPTVLLCSELKPLHCHRRLVLEYLQENWGGLNVRHL